MSKFGTFPLSQINYILFAIHPKYAVIVNSVYCKYVLFEAQIGKTVLLEMFA